MLSSCGGIGLAEGLEKASALIRRQTNPAVTDCEFQLDPVGYSLFELN
jgi:hypothetical protein